jgi:tetratricopeptide (TPR) repeat protein
VKRRYYPWLTQALYLTPLTVGALVGCQGVAATSFDLLTPPAISVACVVDEAPESAPTLGPGTSVPTLPRLAQPTMVMPSKGHVASVGKTSSAAPGSSDSTSARSLLLKATAALEKNDLVVASTSLRRYLQAYPDSTLIRMQLAELYFKQEQYNHALREFQTALADVPDVPLPFHCVLHGHSRLMELAAGKGDRFGEELHRGIGLALLAEHRSGKNEPEMAGVEQLLGKARSALVRAQLLSPLDARPALHLVSVWHQMQQPTNARSAWEKALLLSHGSRLTAHEQMQLAQWGLVLK